MLLGEFSEKISSVVLTNLSVSVPDPADCDSLRHYRLHLLPPQRRGLQVSLELIHWDILHSGCKKIPHNQSNKFGR